MGLEGLPATGIVAKSQGIHDEMVGNALYPAPVPTVVVMQTDIDTLAAANAEVDNNGGKAAHQAKRMAEAKVRANLKNWVGYVQMASGGDADMILSSGFEVVKRGSPLGELNPPKNLGARFTNMAGRVSLKWDREVGSDLHHVFMSTSNNPFKWELIGATTKSRFNADTLEPGTVYWFSVTAIGAAGESSKSDVLLARAA